MCAVLLIVLIDDCEMWSGSENDLTSVEHNLPLFMVNTNDTADTVDTAAATVTAVSWC